MSLFLQGCTDSNNTYQQFKACLGALNVESSRQETAELLRGLEQAYFDSASQESFLQSYHFSFHQIDLGSQLPRLRLLQLPSIFSPEEWSFTFFEGLSRFSAERFEGERLAELGCGNGWVTIALALRHRLDKIYGLDINPRSVTCAQINLYLNSFADNGELFTGASSRPLWERVEFHTSDLLQYVLDEDHKLDRVVGCIPQVLAPDPEALLQRACESDSDQALYDLSNYTDAHGYLEDQFGLGLIAKALEQSVSCLRAGGSLIFNLGGRPGTQVLEGLFLRRGCLLDKVWTTRVEQAGDTDIQALVDIEANYQHRFEFFMNRDCEEPISAKTAQAYGQAGGRIFHALSVYEVSLPAHEQQAKIISYVSRPENKSLHDALDLSHSDGEIYMERVRFLAYLAQLFSEERALPYGDTSGILPLRVNIARFLRIFHRTPVEPQQLLIAPSRSEILSSYLSCYRPNRVLMDHQLIEELQHEDPSWYQYVSGEIMEAPQGFELVMELMKRVRPQLLVTALSPFESQSDLAFESLVRESAALNVHVIIDISKDFDLSSKPSRNSPLNFMSRYSLPEHVTLVCGLVKNKVYKDLQLSFVLSESQRLLDHLSSAAEFSYSRTPLLVQHYYFKILDDLLGFHMTHARGSLKSQGRPAFINTAVSPLNLSDSAALAFEHPCIRRNELPLEEDSIRLDYGENELPFPKSLAEGLYEAFVRRIMEPGQAEAQDEIKAYLRHFYDLNVHSSDIVTGAGVAPLYASFLRELGGQGGSLILPQGNYGEFMAAAQFFGVNLKLCPTEESNGFKYTPTALHQALEQTKGPSWVFVNGPIVNPTGSVYSQREMQEIIPVLKAHGAGLLLDTTFEGLYHNGPEFRLSLLGLFSDDLPWVLLASVSKFFAAGGLRFGFAVSNQRPLLAQLRKKERGGPHFTSSYAVKSLMSKFLGRDPALVAELGEQRLLLAKRAETLGSLLKSMGWKVLTPEGGLFLIAKPEAYLGKRFSNESFTSSALDATAVAQALFHEVGVLVNGDDWTGIPGYCRFVLSVKGENFKKALEGLKKFHELVQGQNS